MIFKKQEWELARLQSLKEEEEKQEKFEADEELLMIYNERIEAQVLKSKFQNANDSFSDIVYSPSPVAPSPVVPTPSSTPRPVPTPKKMKKTVVGTNTTPKTVRKVGRPRKNPITPNITTPAAGPIRPSQPYQKPVAKLPITVMQVLTGDRRPATIIGAPVSTGVHSRAIQQIMHREAPPPQGKHLRMAGKPVSGVYANKVMNPSIVRLTSMNVVLNGPRATSAVLRPRSAVAVAPLCRPVTHLVRPLRPLRSQMIAGQPTTVRIVGGNVGNTAIRLQVRPSPSNIIRPSNQFLQQLNSANAPLHVKKKQPMTRHPNLLASNNQSIRIVHSPAFPGKKIVTPIIVNAANHRHSLFPLLDTLSSNSAHEIKVINKPILINSTRAQFLSQTRAESPNLFDRFANIQRTSPIKVLPISTVSPVSSHPRLIPVALPSQYKIIRTLKSTPVLAGAVGMNQFANVVTTPGISIVRPSLQPQQPQQRPVVQHQQRPLQRLVLQSQQRLPLQARQRLPLQAQQRPLLRTQQRPSLLTQQRPSLQTQQRPLLRTQQRPLLRCLQRPASKP